MVGDREPAKKAPRRIEMVPRGIQGGSKVDQRWFQARSKKGPRRTQMVPRSIQYGADMTKDGSKEDPRRLQEGLRWFQ